MTIRSLLLLSALSLCANSVFADNVQTKTPASAEQATAAKEAKVEAPAQKLAMKVKKHSKSKIKKATATIK